MKINENGKINPLQTYQKNNAAGKAAKETKAAGRDELVISSEALEMAKKGPDQVNQEERAAHLAQIKQSVQSGTYEIDARKVAEKIARYLIGE